MSKRLSILVALSFLADRSDTVEHRGLDGDSEEFDELAVELTALEAELAALQDEP